MDDLSAFSGNSPIKKVLGEYFEGNMLDDGVYDASDIPFYYIPFVEHGGGKITDEGLEFVKEYGPENIFVATGYQVEGVFLFAGKPSRLGGGGYLGSFGQGANCLFIDPPKRLLLIAEDD